MSRIETDPNYSSPTFSRATAPTDLFKKEDVQNLAAAISTHVHDGVHGLKIVASSIPAGTITGAMIASGAVGTAQLAGQAVSIVGYAAGATTDPVTSSPSFADMADMALNFNSGGGPILLWFVGAFSPSLTTEVAQVAFGLDGTTDVQGMIVPQPGIGNGIVALSNMYVWTGQSVGIHSIKARWTTNSGSLKAVGTARFLLGVELKR